jgi:IclR family transcriptional regulator, KDG regulon repressor
MSQKYTAPAVGKLLDMIELMAREPRGFSINEIAKTLNHPVNTVYRICKEMESRRYFEMNSETGRYQLGSRFFVIGQVVGSRIDLRTKALPIMESLRDELGETVHLCILQEGWMVLLDQVETQFPIRVHAETGALLHAHASAFGKCLLSHCPSEELDGMMEKELVALTEKTITSPLDLRSELEKIQNNGYALDMEEYIVGCRCIGAPVHGKSKQGVAAIGIMGPTFRLPEHKMKEVIPAVQKAAEELSIALGYVS